MAGTQPLLSVKCYSRMTRSLEHISSVQPGDAKVLGDIKTHGWHVVKVFARENEPGPEWAFSIGLFHSFGHPEVLVFGLALDNCMKVINEIGRQVKAGSRYESDREYPDILTDPYRCVFKTVETKNYRRYVGYALWFYECDPFPMFQCFWPDKGGHFPWDSRCNQVVKERQPLLFMS
jgi:hypothetical protein